MLSKDKLDSILAQIKNIGIITPTPLSTVSELDSMFSNVLVTLTNTFMEDMIKAIENGVSFNQNPTYHDPQMLIFITDEDSIMKTAVQYELFKLVMLRSYWRMPTIFISDKPLEAPFLTANRVPAFTISADELQV